MAGLYSYFKTGCGQRATYIFGELLEGCWHDAPEQRFSFDKVLGRMNALVAMSATDAIEGLNGGGY